MWFKLSRIYVADMHLDAKQNSLEPRHHRLESLLTLIIRMAVVRFRSRPAG